MEKIEIQQAFEAWLPVVGLSPAPAAGIKDLKGRAIPVAKFTDEEMLRYFFPRRTLPFQQRLVKHLAVHIRKRGGKVESVALTPHDYACWLGNRADTPETRYRFATEIPSA